MPTVVLKLTASEYASIKDCAEKDYRTVPMYLKHKVLSFVLQESRAVPVTRAKSLPAKHVHVDKDINPDNLDDIDGIEYDED